MKLIANGREWRFSNRGWVGDDYVLAKGYNNTHLYFCDEKRKGNDSRGDFISLSAVFPIVWFDLK